MWSPLRLLVLSAAAAAPLAAATAASPGVAANFQEWLQHVDFSPPTLHLDMSASPGMGDTTFEGGNCNGLLVRSVTMQDLSVGPNLMMTFNISGVDVRCSLNDNATDVVADVVMSDSWVSASLAVQSFAGFGQPLPVATQMGNCRTHLDLTSLTITHGPSARNGTGADVARFDANKAEISNQIRASLDALLCDFVPNIVTTMGSNLLSNVAMIAAQLLTPRPLQPLPAASRPVVDWGQYPPIMLGKAMLTDRLSTLSSGPLRSELGARIGVTQDFAIRLDALEVAGLTTIPVSSVVLTGSNGTIDAGASVGRLSVSTAARFEVSPMQQQGLMGLVQGLNLTVSLSDFALFVQAIAMLGEEEFNQLDVPQLQQPGCHVQCAKSAVDTAMVSPMGVRELRANMSSFVLRFLVPGTPLATDLAAVVETTLDAVLTGYLPTLVAIANGLSSYLFNSLNDRLWVHLDDSTRYPCNATQGVEGVASDAALTSMWSTSIGLAVVAALAGGASLVAARRRAGSAAPAKAVEAKGAKQPSDPADVEASEPPAPAPVAREDLSLAQAEAPRALAIAFPIAVVAVMFLFLYADLDLGTSVDVEITAGGASTTFGSLFTFSLISTVTSTWRAEAYAISVLTLLFSGLWPLVKLTLLLVAWLLPPRKIGLRTRGRLLSFLDVWGKYSFLDSWFLVLCMSAFSMEWRRGADTAMEVKTQPTMAYYAFLLATVLSLLLGNVASYFHHRAEAPKKVTPVSQGQATATTARRTALGRDGRHVAVYLAVSALLLTCTVVTVAAAFVMSFEFGMTGLGAQVIFSKARHTDAYSLLSVGVGVSASAPRDVGLLGLETLFLLISFVVPVLLLLALVLVWVLPLQARQQSHLLYVCHILDSWSTLDVFVLTILVGHAEFSQLAGRLIATGSLRSVCGMLEGFNLHCMELDLAYLPGFGLLLTAGAVHLVVPKTVRHLCRKTIREREARLAKVEEAKCTPDELKRGNSYGLAEGGHSNAAQPQGGNIELRLDWI